MPTLPVTELSTRARDIFRLVVEGYLTSGQPVGSKTLAGEGGLNLSPASIRSVLAELEMLGLLAAPHTSAGRMPTESGLRLFVDGMLGRAAAMGSPGIDELRWPKPVRPGDTLEARLEILEVRPSRSKPDRGIVRLRSVMVNQDREEVLSFIGNVMFRRRPGSG